MCDELAITNQVVFHGSCDNVHTEILNAEIFLMTSHYEGIPNALLEAMAMGFPVIAVDCPSGGVRMLIKNKSVGILLKEYRAEDISRALCYLTENSIKAIEMGKAAQYVREEYSIQKVGAKWEALIEKNKGK